ncbi:MULTISPECIES: hypothetical protein [unclassified Sporosarcina]|uniref:hypothetical protein n=1 Tax=unclassified Sporosarcina TaxID=2647733 RepID=UPI00203C11B0|nr:MULTISPECIES: hypothetical protein [unclassified Sporosarcina]GKV66714.1 hypothetical protein NCCP2331_28670 [Sporosarcina sp. NCCP-2331]GLB57103.1 hypothetical protein NCCP2378_28900 [Sporosarcina sp. NCCP-2378]
MTDRLIAMITDYKNHGERVDEVLFQEVTKTVHKLQKADDLLQKLYYEMGKNAGSDIELWQEIKWYMNIMKASDPT